MKNTPRYFKISPKGNRIHKYSVYMQSKDSDWISRNLKKSQEDDENYQQEPLEEDIRD